MNELYLVKIQPQTSVTLLEAEYLLEKNAITHPIQQLNWEQFHYSPKVAFRIAHTGDRIWLKYYVSNKPFDTQSGDFTWEMMIRIPIECFAFSDVKNLSNLSGSANFYKCGDATTEPHYLSWNSIETDNPDFHRPDFFGKVFFE